MIEAEKGWCGKCEEFFEARAQFLEGASFGPGGAAGEGERASFKLQRGAGSGLAVGSAIEWTEATWNPATGCDKVSPGCKNCYAEALAGRLRAMGQKKYRLGFRYAEHPSDVGLPLTWRRPRKIFVNSMSDLFHEGSEFEFTGKCFATMIRADWHDYQVLTKRPRRMAEFSVMFEEYFGHRIPNFIWMGTSVENRDFASRISDLRRVRCRTRFVSFEPLIGSVGRISLRNVDWAIIGGESGRNFRPVRKEWIEEIIDQCIEQRVPVFFKQWGGFRPKSGGRTIRGREYGEYPELRRRNELSGARDGWRAIPGGVGRVPGGRPGCRRRRARRRAGGAGAAGFGRHRTPAARSRPARAAGGGRGSGRRAARGGPPRPETRRRNRRDPPGAAPARQTARFRESAGGKRRSGLLLR